MDVPPALPVVEPPNARKVRALGWLLSFIGLGLSAGIAFIAFSLYDTIRHNDQPGSHSHWRGSAEFTRTTFELFGAVFLFGLIALAAGIHQARTGRRTPWLIVPLLLAFALIVYLGRGILAAPSPIP